MKYMKNFLWFKPLATGVMMFTAIFLTLSILMLLVNSNALMDTKNPPIFLVAIVLGFAVTWMLAFIGEYRDSKGITGLAFLAWTIVILMWIGLIVLTVGLKNKMACISNGSKCPPTLWLSSSSGGVGTTSMGEVSVIDNPASIIPENKSLSDTETGPKIKATPSKYLPPSIAEKSNKTSSSFELKLFRKPLVAYYDDETFDKYMPMDQVNLDSDYHDFDEGDGKKKPGKKKKDSGAGSGAGSGSDDIMKILPLMVFFLVLMAYAWFTLLSYYAELKSIASCRCNGSCCRQCRP